MRVLGEDDALARGALLLRVRPRKGAAYLLTCALGFADASMPTGVWGGPGDLLCALAGGYAYVADSMRPECCWQVNLRPVIAVHSLVKAGLLLFVGFQKMVAWGVGGQAWQTGRLSWEGVRVTEITDTEVRGFGWDLMADREREFVVDLASGRHTGGGFQAR